MSSSTEAAAAPRVIVLRAGDGETFEVEESVAAFSQTIKHMIEDDCASTTIPLANVNSDMLSKVIEYCKRHVGVPEKFTEDDLKAFDAEFVKLDLATLLDLILAANYLDIKSLLDVACQAVADMIKDMSPEEIREIFNIENDFTAEEEAKVRREYAWAFE